MLVIHGGPRAASLETFAAQAQIFAARGWVVFQPNYRGSDQLGNDYQSAIINDAGAGPGRDVMAGLEAAQEARVRRRRREMAVSGWSYGGYMTTWLFGNYHGLASGGRRRCGHGLDGSVQPRRRERATRRMPSAAHPGRAPSA